MSDRKAMLVAKVKATNAAHKVAIDLYPIMAAAFAPFIGQKIMKVDGTLLAKVKALVPALPVAPRLNIYMDTSSNYIAFNISTNAQVDEHSSIYGKVMLYVARLNVGTVEKMLDAPDLRSDYTPEEITAKREAYKAAEEIAREAKYALNPFGEYDN